MPVPRSDFPPDTIATLLGITERRLQQLAVEGFIPRAARGLYPLVGSVQGYIRYLKDRPPRHAATGEPAAPAAVPAPTADVAAIAPPAVDRDAERMARIDLVLAHLRELLLDR